MFTSLKKKLDNFNMACPDNNNNNSEKVQIRGDKYSLRPRSLPKEEHNKKEEYKKIRKEGKSKQKAAPLSKYRRKTANARERSRMKEINAAFEALRRCVPSPLSLPLHTPSNNEKLTKITTLRLAMKYISALTAALNETNPIAITDLGELLSHCSDLDCLFLDSDGESLQLHSDFSNHSLTPSNVSTDFSDNLGSNFEEFTEQPLSPFEPFFSDFT